MPSLLTIISTLTPFVKVKLVGPPCLPLINPKVWETPFCLKAKTLPFHPSPQESVTVK